jgi:hypothetical protein
LSSLRLRGRVFPGGAAIRQCEVEFPLDSIAVRKLKALRFLQDRKTLLCLDDVKSEAPHFEDMHLLTSDVPAGLSYVRFGVCQGGFESIATHNETGYRS